MPKAILNNAAIYTIAICCFMLSACKTKKIVTKDIDETNAAYIGNAAYFLGELRKKQVSFDSFAARAKTNLILNGNNQDVTLNIRIKDKEAIWISVTAILGIEAARVLITPDSLKMINRLNSEYISKPFSELHKYTTKQLDFQDLQAILVGNVIAPAMSEDASVRQTDSMFVFSGTLTDLDFAIQTSSDFANQISQITNRNQQQSLVVNYSNFALFKQKKIPQRIKIRSEAPDTRLFANMEYDRIEINSTVQLPFSIPNRYREIH